MSFDIVKWLTTEICNKIMKPEYDLGMITQEPRPDEIKQAYSSKVGDLIIPDEVWGLVCDEIDGWRYKDESRFMPLRTVIFQKYTRFPTVEKVITTFGEARGAKYKAALETLEDCHEYNSIHISQQTWRKLDIYTAVCIITDVLGPNIDNDIALERAYVSLLQEIKHIKKEKSLMLSSTKKERKSIVRKMGMWFPATKDLHIWRNDPRTAPYAEELIALALATSKKMKLRHSLLQYVPRRHVSTRTCKDLQNNMQRMRSYIESS